MHTDKVLLYRKNEQGHFTSNDWINFRKYTATFYEDHALRMWKQILPKNLLYKQPHLINAAHTREDFYKQLHFMAAMFKVGKHEFIIRHPQ